MKKLFLLSSFCAVGLCHGAEDKVKAATTTAQAQQKSKATSAASSSASSSSSAVALKSASAVTHSSATTASTADKQLHVLATQLMPHHTLPFISCPAQLTTTPNTLPDLSTGTQASTVGLYVKTYSWVRPTLSPYGWEQFTMGAKYVAVLVGSGFITKLKTTLPAVYLPATIADHETRSGIELPSNVCLLQDGNALKTDFSPLDVVKTTVEARGFHQATLSDLLPKLAVCKNVFNESGSPFNEGPVFTVVVVPPYPKS